MSRRSKRDRFTLLNYFRPSIFLKSFTDFDPFLLKINKIKLFICDLDNTLAPHFTFRPTKAAINFVSEIKKMGIKFYIVSNNRKSRVKKFCEYIDPDGFISFAMKPRISKIKKLMKKLKVSPDETLMMGDQFVIDILAANRIGCKSILVLPLVEQEKNKSSRFVNFLDKLIYSRLERDNLLIGTKSFDNDTKLL
ncbi:MAG: YqeG family HAD IIIA-type phosphatase [Mycoplasmoidaceae bacterium]|nr:YqeG family HAD IIIA-type phosphatase [Mycoplasmoidaceae bacterium]